MADNAGRRSAARIGREKAASVLSVKIDRGTQLTPAELDALRGPYVRQPADTEPREWLRWAREVEAAAPLARRLLDAQAKKERGNG